MNYLPDIVPWTAINISQRPYEDVPWAFNPSIYRDPVSGAWLCMIRCANYCIPKGVTQRWPARSNGRPRTRNALLVLDPKTWRVTELHKMDELDTTDRRIDGPHGYEDLRLFSTERDGLIGIAASSQLNHAAISFVPNGLVEQVLCRFDAAWNIVEATPLRGPWRTPQKNWIPFSGSPTPRYLYSIEGGVVITEEGVEIDGVVIPPDQVADQLGRRRALPQSRTMQAAPTALSWRRASVGTEMRVGANGRGGPSGLRGGSQLSPLGDGRWLGIGHEMELLNGLKRYWHTLFTCDWNGRLLERSEAFKLSKCAIEFAAGMAIDGTRDLAMISFGTDDYEAWLGETKLSALLGTLRSTGSVRASLPIPTTPTVTVVKATPFARDLRKLTSVTPPMEPAPIKLAHVATLVPWKAVNISQQPFDDTPWSFNPSVHRDPTSGIWRAVMRCANYCMPNGVARQHYSEDERPRTRNAIVTLDPKTWRVITCREMQELDGVEAPSGALGYEDMRLFSTERDGVIGIAAASRRGAGLVEQVLCRFDAEWNIVESSSLRASWRLPQKNWMPFADSPEPRFLYSIEDGVVVTGPEIRLKTLKAQWHADIKFRGGAKQPVKAPPNVEPASFGSGMRGGSQLCPLGDGRWLGIGHDMTFVKGLKRYWHTLFTCDWNGKILERSEPFKLSKCTIEFAAGLAIDLEHDLAVISFGTDDYEAWIGETKLSAVLEQLKPVTKEEITNRRGQAYAYAIETYEVGEYPSLTLQASIATVQERLAKRP